jgi:glutathione synthase/RimK-type ligase-like ATP-grasp enzyme
VAKNTKSNQERYIVKILKEICAEQSISLTSFSYDWIFKLSKNGRIGFVFGYNFANNNSTAAKICDDKCAAGDVLLNAGIPAVEHFFYMVPNSIHHIGESGNWLRLMEFLKLHGKIVCKSNEGSSGNSVYLVKNQLQLEEATHRIFKQSRTMAVSPFYDIKKEYRAIVLNGNIKLLYSKNIPNVTGDGKSTLFTLIIRYMQKNNFFIDTNSMSADKALFSILPSGKLYNLGWKSNLGQGAQPKIIGDEDKRKALLSELAKKAAIALSIQFASVDMIDIGEKMLVLEVNSGIMMENFVGAKNTNYAIAKRIYQQAIESMLAE